MYVSLFKVTFLYITCYLHILKNLKKIQMLTIHFSEIQLTIHIIYINFEKVICVYIHFCTCTFLAFTLAFKYLRPWDLKGHTHTSYYFIKKYFYINLICMNTLTTEKCLIDIERQNYRVIFKERELIFNQCMKFSSFFLTKNF